MHKINHLHVDESKWFAVHTKYKCEKYVAQQISKKGIEVYLPLTDRVRVYASKTKKYKVPLISCYIFVKICKHEYVRVLETEYAINFLRQRKDLISIPDKEINLLKLLVGEYEVSLYDEKVNWALGQKMEVVAGQLTGLHGVLIEKCNKRDFVVELQNIGIQLQMQFRKEHLMPIF